ncbi:hypothetical protein H0H81_002418 [Sphagnurus paluster]|uniref:RRM domain-containing protein n=1 Tax=Sphagnurus paluster TaxID=117069 RepID=A0A9P7FTC0_9AGAR|nr:hypothetical protein H0H81_002418 [Sphagnurus paluster]
MREQYMRTGEGFLLVYSITSRNSFEEISTFHQQILRVKDQDSFPVIVVANKCDLEYERQVGMNGVHQLTQVLDLEGRDLAKHFGCKFIETSAKQRINVDEAFSNLVREIRKYNKEQQTGRPAVTGPGGNAPAPKKAKKISLNEFLGDGGSWADEMDSLPNAPAVRSEDDQGRPGDRYGRRDDFLSSRPDRGGPPRDDVPLPTQPPYTAYIGNLAFDLTESELEEFFTPSRTKSVKIIKDREDKPKGFGYIEFEELDGLKDALAKSGSILTAKERGGFGGGGGFEDEAKFDNPWRRDGPLPDREPQRRRFDTPSGGDRDRALPSVAEGVSDWRSSRPARVVPEDPPIRRRSGFSTPEGQPSPADQAEVWTKGSKFVPSAPPSEDRFGSHRGRGDMAPPRESPADEGDWRSSRPKSSVSRAY